jgi:hypothetical protein
MNDIGMLTGPVQELDCRLGKEREPLRVIPISVEVVPAEEVGRRVRLDEKHFRPPA